MNSSEFWRGKLVAFLHDPPDKPLNIRDHEQRRIEYLKRAGLEPEMIAHLDKRADYIAAAADRFPFPSAGQLRSEFSGDEQSPFHHPLSDSVLAIGKPFATEAEAEEIFQVMQNGLDWSGLPPEEKAHGAFFLHWRRWPECAARKDERTAFLPADTRLPDHNVWAHNSIVSALQGCVDEKGNLVPAFLLFQLGPVQEFISQARSTRDLWSGSYLLSWLMARAIKTVTDKFGPDCVIFPSLRGQPIFDLLHRESIYENVTFKKPDGTTQALWERMKVSKDAILTPNLPNRFFAVVPAAEARSIAEAASKAVRDELAEIGSSCWGWLDKFNPMEDAWKERYTEQLEIFPQIAWQVLPLERKSTESILNEFVRFEPAAGSPAQNLRKIHEVCSKDAQHEIGMGFAWPYWYAQLDRLLGGRRNLRDFAKWATDKSLAGTVKDSLSGKEEVVGDEDWWKRLKERPELASIFKSSDRLGAVNLLKKVWHKAYLDEKWGLNTSRNLRFLSTQEIAQLFPGEDDPEGEGVEGRYYAVIAIDGDNMGKWISGAQTPLIEELFSKEAKTLYQGKLQGVRRPLSPSYHLQFSEALANFGLHLARKVVEEGFGGQLIYSGGDDVLAMTPAHSALQCAKALRAAFRGDREGLRQLVPGMFEVSGDRGGFVKIVKRHECEEDGEPSWPLLVPGPRAEVSAGIAIGHIKAPLQGMVREAQAAEKRAKKNGKGGFALTLFKRSGETLEWGAKWDSGAIELLNSFWNLSEADLLSGRFGYALAELLDKYSSLKLSDGSGVEDLPDFPVKDVLNKELAHVLSRQGRSLKGDALNSFIKDCNKYAGELSPESMLDEFSMLFRVGNFIMRKERS